jgi:peptidoglycan DL-endopeptidase RipA
MSEALTKIETMNAVDLFERDQFTNAIEFVRREAAKLVPDVSTVSGRKEIASVAYNVARSKTLLDKVGKDYVAEMKNKAKIVDDKRKLIRDELDALRDEVRKPLDEWEKKEADRMSAIADRITKLRAAGRVSDRTIDELRSALEAVNAETLDGFDEFEAEAQRVINEARFSLRQAIELHELREAEAKRKAEEAARLAAEEAARLEAEEAKRKQEERERLEREAREKAEAEAAAKVAAAEEAARKAEEAARLAAEAEKQRVIAEAKRKAEEAIEAAKREQARIAQAKIDQERAVEAERKRIEAAKAAAAAEAAQREADALHKARIVGEIANAFEPIIGQLAAQQAAIALAAKKIPHVTVTF